MGINFHFRGNIYFGNLIITVIYRMYLPLESDPQIINKGYHLENFPNDIDTGHHQETHPQLIIRRHKHMTSSGDAPTGHHQETHPHDTNSTNQHP